jgi:hypothetical protein
MLKDLDEEEVTGLAILVSKLPEPPHLHPCYASTHVGGNLGGRGREDYHGGLMCNATTNTKVTEGRSRWWCCGGGIWTTRYGNGVVDCGGFVMKESPFSHFFGYIFFFSFRKPSLRPSQSLSIFHWSEFSVFWAHEKYGKFLLLKREVISKLRFSVKSGSFMLTTHVLHAHYSFGMSCRYI